MADTPYEKLDTAYFEMPIPNSESYEVIRILNKEGFNRLWIKIGDKFVRIPSGGSVGQALVKTDNGISWGDVAADIPDVIPVENGGTGCTTIDGIRTMLFNFPTEDQIDEYFGFE